MVLGEDGIIAQAKLAAERTKEAEEQAQGDLANLTEEISNILTSDPPTPTRPTVAPSPTPKTVREAIEQKYEFTQNTPLEDEYGNKVTIPKGFKIVPNGTSSVTYSYSTKNPGTPTVQDGIVIEDVSAGDEISRGNQFVWIPVGNIENKDGITTTITLGRYTFASNDGKETLKQNATNYTEEVAIDTYYKELTESKYGNTVANTLNGFIGSAQKNKGYYLARYEASYGGTNKPLSKPSIRQPATGNGESYAPSTNSQKGQLWNNITQANAATVARAMYSTNENYTSDLTNSYAWDTAIVFIQKYSGDKDYSKEEGKTLNNTLRNTGAGEGDKADKRCNIYDMASNCLEWTTETSLYSSHPCVCRGGYYDSYYYFTDRRDWGGTSNAFSNYSFRPILYVK